MKKIVATLLICCMSTSVLSGEIKAIINDTPISSYDVTERAKLMQLQQPSQTKDLSQEELHKKTLQVLIDERIKKEEAQKQGFSVSKSDISEAIARLEQQNNMSTGEMAQALKRNDIHPDTLTAQVESDLLWLQVLSKNKSMLTPVTAADISAKKSLIKSQLAKPSYLLAEIVVSSESEAQKLFEDIKNGTPFSEVAKQKSIAKSAKTDGLIGWVSDTHYPKSVMDRIDQMEPNEMTKPIKYQNNWLIVLLLDTQAAAKDGKITIWDLAQMATPKHKTISLIPEIFKTTTCDAFSKIAQTHAIKGSYRHGLVDPNGLPPELKQTLRQQKSGTPIGPINTPEGDLFFMKCAEQQQSVLPSDEMIKSSLEMERMDELSNKLLRQVKRYVVIEYK